MGMAASQARLLSITSRMADNELRSQLINNSKMRLTEDSAKASDRYISALNKTQLMMSNKDATGNKMYQQLTFNNLTSYSSYNNQYGLMNKAGEIVVSEIDAARFTDALQEADNDPEVDALTKFLESYGLEKDETTYWESNEIDDELKTRYEGDIKYDDNAKRLTGLHYGYELSKDSTEVMVYERLLKEYKIADNSYTSAVAKAMKEYLTNLVPPGYKEKYADKYAEVIKYDTSDPANNPSLATAQGALDYLSAVFNDLNNKGYIKTETMENGKKVPSPFVDAMKYYLNDMLTNEGGTLMIDTPVSIVKKGESYELDGGTLLISGTEGAYTVALGPNANTKPKSPVEGEAYGYTIVENPSGITKNGDYYEFTYKETEVEVDEKGNENKNTSTKHCSFKTNPLEAFVREPCDQNDAANAVKDVYTFFQQNILNHMDRDKFGHLAPDEQKAFFDASKQLSMFIFGEDIGPADYEKLDDMEWILNSGKETTNLDGDTKIILEQIIDKVPTDVEYQANFEAIKDIYLVDKMIEEFGPPKFTWIDRANPNENADAKAKWYTNLFNKMQESGFQEIKKELTESPEWIQYAFESGLLTMLQVNDEFQWVPTMYSNCSDITEDTVQLEITRAEAEYKRETQKIQAKDKRYDLELKNIDTEHNSLQAEYESIKAVINKNVERHFKLFS